MKTVSLQPYETLFSWLSRTHIRYGVGPVARTYHALLGKTKVRLHPYMPQGLRDFSALTEKSTGTLLSQHTLYPLFRYFHADEQGRLKHTLLTGEGSSTHAANIPHARLHIPLHHKYCPLCAREQRLRLGFAYFDFRHQLPGLIACERHQVTLTGVLCGDGALDSAIALPQEKRPVSAVSVITSAFSQFCVAVSEQCSTSLIQPYLMDNYRHLLDRKGYLTRHHQLRLQQVKQALGACYEALQLDRGTESLRDYAFLGPLLRQRTGYPAHPLKHLLLGFWLFDGVSTGYLKTITPVEQQSLPLADTASLEAKTLALLKQQVSFATIAKRLGKSRCYVRRIAQLNQVSYQHNALMFDARVRHRVIIQALLGRHRRTIANNLGVGMGYVEQVISNTRGLRQWRQVLTHKHKRVKAIYAIEQARIAHPDWLQKDIKQQESQAFFYLYHHDREALKQCLPPRRAPTPPPFDWAKEDMRLIAALKQLTAPYPQSLSAAGRAISDNGHLRKNLTKLPRTHAQLVAYQIIDK